MDDYKISIREIERMIFISNALNDGWTVRRVGVEKYEFIKDNVAIFEQAETQKLVNQVQQDMQLEQATPIEEGMMQPQMQDQMPPAM